METTTSVVSSNPPEVCDFDMGLDMKATNTINAASLTASSSAKDSSPEYGRLNYEEDDVALAWRPALDVTGQYLQVRARIVQALQQDLVF